MGHQATLEYLALLWIKYQPTFSGLEKYDQLEKKRDQIDILEIATRRAAFDKDICEGKSVFLEGFYGRHDRQL